MSEDKNYWSELPLGKYWTGNKNFPIVYFFSVNAKPVVVSYWIAIKPVIIASSRMLPGTINLSLSN